MGEFVIKRKTRTSFFCLRDDDDDHQYILTFVSIFHPNRSHTHAHMQDDEDEDEEDVSIHVFIPRPKKYTAFYSYGKVLLDHDMHRYTYSTQYDGPDLALGHPWQGSNRYQK
jgi:hypothetical protein